MTDHTPKPGGWTPERRARHAEAIRKWAPWKKSTGPKTALGKARSSQNAWKHGKRTIEVTALSAAVRKQKQLHSYAARYAARFSTNELLNDAVFAWIELMLENGRNDIAALLGSKIMQKPCFFGGSGANS